MVQTISASQVTFQDLRTKFGLQLVEDTNFFREWQDALPEISDTEKQRLDRVKASFVNLLDYPPLLENTVKMVVLAPLLDLADFYLSPFHVRSETPIQIVSEDDGVVVKGQMDVTVWCDRFWVMAIESKKAEFDIDAGRPQLLAYMMASPNEGKPTFGTITNGSKFRFLKLVKLPTPQYAMSGIFDIFNPSKDLYEVLRILKHIRQLIQV